MKTSLGLSIYQQKNFIPFEGQTTSKALTYRHKPK